MLAHILKIVFRRKRVMNKETDNHNPKTGNTQTWATRTLCEKPGHQTEQSSPYAVFTELKEAAEGRVGNGLLKSTWTQSCDGKRTR